MSDEKLAQTEEEIDAGADQEALQRLIDLRKKAGAVNCQIENRSGKSILICTWKQNESSI